jgi:hypothetical protein
MTIWIILKGAEVVGCMSCAVDAHLLSKATPGTVVWTCRLNATDANIMS